MSTYIVGDVQGCFSELTELLSTISFNPLHDSLGFAGDLVNRGPDSLGVLRLATSLKNSFAVLGNHDLALLALHFGAIKKSGLFLTEILEAPDRKKLIDWLLEKPLLIADEMHHYALVHAGIPPQWSIEKATQEARETELLLQKNPEAFLKNMYGNLPDEWSDNLTGWDRARYVINAFTRMRFCTHEGKLDFENTSNVSIDETYRPWFEWRHADKHKIIFGHWASLMGRCDKPGFYALDTGCVWGHALTALRVDNWKIHQVNAKN
jgi:bis(5'-nucleosyl)-tetraphosphatase (symmetrical)